MVRQRYVLYFQSFNSPLDDCQRKDMDTGETWPDRYFVADDVRGYCMCDLSSRGTGFGSMVTGGGGRYPNAECGRQTLLKNKLSNRHAIHKSIKGFMCIDPRTRAASTIVSMQIRAMARPPILSTSLKLVRMPIAAIPMIRHQRDAVEK